MDSWMVSHRAHKNFRGQFVLGLHMAIVHQQYTWDSCYRRCVMPFEDYCSTDHQSMFLFFRYPFDYTLLLVAQQREWVMDTSYAVTGNSRVVGVTVISGCPFGDTIRNLIYIDCRCPSTFRLASTSAFFMMYSFGHQESQWVTECRLVFR